MKLTYISLFSLLVGCSLAMECGHPSYTLVGDQCKEILCQADSQCTAFKGGCAGKGTPFCRPLEGICGCSTEKVEPYNNSLNNCNKGHACLPGELCTTAGNCIDNPICYGHAELCTAQSDCCPGLFCSMRFSYYESKKCFTEAEITTP